MFCAACGTEQPSDSQFCRKCGRSLASEGSRKSGRAKRPIVLGALLAIVVVWALIFALAHTGRAPASLRQLTAQHHTVRLGGSALTVANLSYSYVQFSVPADAANVSVTGHFTASGGTGNDIEAYILTADGFVNFQNGHQATNCYDSGRVTQGTVNVNLPSGAAQYYLVFNNSFSLLSSKSVQASVTLNYME